MIKVINEVGVYDDGVFMSRKSGKPLLVVSFRQSNDSRITLVTPKGEKLNVKWADLDNAIENARNTGV